MSNTRIAIVVDSTAAIPSALVEQYGLYVIPQNLIWEGATLKDGVDITPDEFYARLKSAKEMPTTSQPSTGEFLEFFEQLSREYDSILGTFISEKLSGTVACAHAAADMMGDYPIEIVDSRSASMGLGFVTLEAARAREEGQPFAEVVAVARDMVRRVRTLFVVDTLEFLHRGGRIGGAQRLLGTMLSIKPLLHLEDGQIEPLASVRTKRKAIERALELAASDTEGLGPVHAAVIHAAAPEEARALFAEVEKRLKPVELLMSDLSPVVGANVGPGLLGIGYFCEP